MWRSAILAAMAMLGTIGTTTAAERRYLALGDSYTIGESVPVAQRWPVQLAAALRADGIAIGEPEIIARTGWTTGELDAAIDAAAPRGPYDLVTLLIGVNDQYRGGDAEAYRGAFAQLLARAIGFAGDRVGCVVVVSIPDWGVTPFGAASGRDVAGIARELDRFNAIAREEARLRGVAFVDITPISRRAGAAVADDGLHPAGAQYAQWVQAIAPVARERIAR